MKFLIPLILIFASIPAIAQSKTDGKAVVYVYSLATTITLGTLKKPIYIDKVELADLQPARYFIVLVEPGEHAFHLRNKKFGGIEQDWKAGQTYYVQMTWAASGTVRPAGITLVAPENGAYDIKQLRPIAEKNIKDKESVLLKLP